MISVFKPTCVLIACKWNEEITTNISRLNGWWDVAATETTKLPTCFFFFYMPKTLLRNATVKEYFWWFRVGVTVRFTWCPGVMMPTVRRELVWSTYSAQPRSRETQYLAYLRDQNLAWWGRWRDRDVRRDRGPVSADCSPSDTPAPDSETDSRVQSDSQTNTHTNKS